MDLDL